MYQIKLENFEGPFDLLLHLIKKEEVSIYDIPIAKITEEFLAYIKMMQVLDLEIAGEFLSMAATLLLIKVQMLFPKNEDDNKSDTDDPRKELVEKLIEYKKFKEVSKQIEKMMDDNKYVYYRQIFDVDYQTGAESVEISYKNLNLFDLLKAFKNVYQRANQENDYEVISLFSITIEDASKLLLNKLKASKKVSFADFVKDRSLPDIIAFFLAVLELLKNKVIVAEQNELFDDIILYEYPQLNLN